MEAFSVEKDVDDDIFNRFPEVEHFKTTKNDINYGSPLFKTHVFKTLNKELYSIVDGMPFRLPLLNDSYGLKKLLNLDTGVEGVFIIKSYSYSRIDNINLALAHLTNYNTMIPDNIIKDVTAFLKSIEKNIIRPNNKNVYIYRLINFISYNDLLKGDRLCNLLNGTVTTRLKEEYDYYHKDNTLTIELSGKGETKWLALGDDIIPLQTSNDIREDRIFVRNSNSKISTIGLTKKETPIIFDTYEEASSNTISNNLKREKFKLEKTTVNLEERKLISDTMQAEAKHELSMFTTEVNYKTELIKYLISENNLLSNEMSLGKGNVDFFSKLLSIGEVFINKFLKEKK